MLLNPAANPMRNTLSQLTRVNAPQMAQFSKQLSMLLLARDTFQKQVANPYANNSGNNQPQPIYKKVARPTPQLPGQIQARLKPAPPKPVAPPLAPKLTPQHVQAAPRPVMPKGLSGQFITVSRPVITPPASPKPGITPKLYPVQPFALPHANRNPLGRINHLTHLNPLNAWQLLNPAKITLGCKPGNTHQLTDPSISENHASISHDGMLTDLGSTHGTFLDGVRLQAPQRLKEGSIIQLGLKKTAFYYHNGNLHPLTGQKAALLLKLFPNGLQNTEFGQGRIGTCSFLATLKSTLAHKPVKIIELIEPAGGNKVRFKFHYPVHKPSSQVVSMTEIMPSGVRGSLGVQLLETAFGKVLKQEEGQRVSTLQALKKGNYGYQAMQALCNDKAPVMVFNNYLPLRTNPDTTRKTLEILEKIANNPAVVATASTHQHHRMGRHIMPNHTYSVLNVNAKNQTITLLNPHNTQRPFQISYQKFLSGFRRLIMSRI